MAASSATAGPDANLRIGAGTDSGNKPENQDTYLVEQLSDHLFVFAVFDGHGVDGKLVAEHCKSNVIEILSGCTPFKKGKFKKAIKQTFATLHQQLKDSKDIDVELSGTTATLLVLNGNELVCGWLGDSRGILCRMKDKKMQSALITTDHHCDMPSEAARIKKAGGRVEPARDRNGNFSGPPRLWATEDRPGLVVSRSLGDELAHTAGGSIEADFQELVVDGGDRAVVIASDGVWDGLDTSGVLGIIDQHKYDPAQEAVDAILAMSKVKLKKINHADNITAVVVFLGDSAKVTKQVRKRTTSQAKKG